MSDLISKSERSSATYSSILATAIDEFTTHGLAGARIDRIAKTASVNKAMIYYHFSSKQNLYMEVVKQLVTRASQQIQPLLPVKQENLSIEEIFSIMAANYQKIFEGSTRLRSLIMRELADPQTEILDKIAKIMGGNEISTVALNAIKAGQKRGEIRPIDPRQILASFMAMNIGYFFLAPISDRVLNIADRGEFIRQRRTAVVDLILNGIKNV